MMRNFLKEAIGMHADLLEKRRRLIMANQETMVNAFLEYIQSPEDASQAVTLAIMNIVPDHMLQHEQDLAKAVSELMVDEYREFTKKTSRMNGRFGADIAQMLMMAVTGETGLQHPEEF